MIALNISIAILLSILAVCLLYIIFLGICTMLVNPKKEYEHYSTFYHIVLKSVAFLMVHLLRIKVHVTGLEKIPADAKPLFVCNHRSNFDPIVTWHILNKWKLAFVSKPSNFKIPFLGRIVRKVCFLPIDRENPRNAIVTINKAAALIRNNEASVGIYPEGTRSKQCVLLPFHNGVFKIAQKADAPIVVMTVVGTEKIHKRTPFRRTHVYLDILDVISAENAKANKTEVIGTTVRELMENNIEKRDV